MDFLCIQRFSNTHSKPILKKKITDPQNIKMFIKINLKTSHALKFTTCDVLPKRIITIHSKLT